MLVMDVLNGSSALLNDISASVFPPASQLPYLNIALNELQEELQLNNVPITNQTSGSIIVDAGVDGIGGGGIQPPLPVALIEPLTLHERTAGSQFSFTEMKKRDFLPVNQVPTAFLIYWNWEGDTIHFIPQGATGQVEILIHYVRSIFHNITSLVDTILYDKGKSFLTYRTAALCAEFIGENKTRADDLNNNAGLALVRVLGIATKGRQAITTRRRPFMSGWRARRII